MSKNYRSPAFPTHVRSSPGMTLRDYFAASIIAGILGNDKMCWNFSGQTTELSQNSMARDAYILADAMIIAREAE